MHHDGDHAGRDRKHLVGGEAQGHETCRFVDGAAQVNGSGRGQGDGVAVGTGLTGCGQTRLDQAVEHSAQGRYHQMHAQHDEHSRQHGDQEGGFEGQHVVADFDFLVQIFYKITGCDSDNQRSQEGGGNRSRGGPGSVRQAQHRGGLGGHQTADETGRKCQLAADGICHEGRKHGDCEPKQRAAEVRAQVGELEQ